MKNNISQMDRVIRAVVGLVLLIIGLAMPMASAAPQIILVILGVALLATAALNFCPLYKLIGFSTKK
jgi:uncharacterized membrane protein